MLLVADLCFGPVALWGWGGVVAVALAVAGRRKEGVPGRKPVLSGPRSFAWAMEPQVLVDAFRDAKLIGKDESLRLVERAVRAGDGWAITVDLPATRKAADVVKNREALASALAVDEVQLVVERVRGRGGHAGRVFLWVADEDPYAGPPVRFPLLKSEWWDAWRPIPFGVDARNRKVDLPLVWTSLLVGAIPRQGKTSAVRVPAAGLILDPHTRLYVFDGKGQANQFDPGAWLDGRAPGNWSLVPFSGGPGRCPGRELVLFLASTFLAALLDAHDYRRLGPARLAPERPLPCNLDPFAQRFSAAPRTA